MMNVKKIIAIISAIVSVIMLAGLLIYCNIKNAEISELYEKAQQYRAKTVIKQETKDEKSVSDTKKHSANTEDEAVEDESEQEIYHGLGRWGWDYDYAPHINENGNMEWSVIRFGHYKQ